jgi:hypothetical protein
MFPCFDYHLCCCLMSFFRLKKTEEFSFHFCERKYTYENLILWHNFFFHYLLTALMDELNDDRENKSDKLQIRLI